MATTVVGLFDDRDEAHNAWKALTDLGVTQSNISVVTADPEGKYETYRIDHEGNLAAGGAVTGAASGAVIGGLFGLLIGAGALTFPALGLVAIGPLAGLLTGAGIGAVSGGVIGGLIGLGIPEEHAHTYAEAIRRGSVLVTATVDDAMVDRVEDVMDSNGAIDIDERASTFRREGFTSYDPGMRPYTREEAQQAMNTYRTNAPAANTAMGSTAPRAKRYEAGMTAGSSGMEMSPEFRNDFATRYAGTSERFEDYEPAYRFGYDVRMRDQFRDRDWSYSEPLIRQEWEQRNPGTWERYRNAIMSGWDRCQARTRRAELM